MPAEGGQCYRSQRLDEVWPRFAWESGASSEATFGDTKPGCLELKPQCKNGFGTQLMHTPDFHNPPLKVTRSGLSFFASWLIIFTANILIVVGTPGINTMDAPHIAFADIPQPWFACSLDKVYSAAAADSTLQILRLFDWWLPSKWSGSLKNSDEDLENNERFAYDEGPLPLCQVMFFFFVICTDMRGRGALFSVYVFPCPCLCVLFALVMLTPEESFKRVCVSKNLNRASLGWWFS